jgi:hypothetical protein
MATIGYCYLGDKSFLAHFPFKFLNIGSLYCIRGLNLAVRLKQLDHCPNLYEVVCGNTIELFIISYKCLVITTSSFN